MALAVMRLKIISTFSPMGSQNDDRAKIFLSINSRKYKLESLNVLMELFIRNGIADSF